MLDINAHNPVARAIEKMQQKWAEATTANPNYTVARWLIDPDEAVLLNGFCKIESSPHGQMPELFVVLFSPFQHYLTYSQQIILDWLTMWEQDKTTAAQATTDWGYEHFKQKAPTQEQADDLLVELLQKFYTAYASLERPLVLGLIPKTVEDFKNYQYWLTTMAPKLPPGIKIMVVDHVGKDYLHKPCEKLKDKAITIPCGDLNVKGMVKNMATSGNPNDPDVQFRKCLFEMGEGLAVKNRSQVEKWGDKALQVTQRSGIKSLYATAHVVYAGFLMHFKSVSHKIKELLDKGITIAQGALKTDAVALSVLVQLYGYQAAYYSMQGEKGQAAAWFAKQAHLTLEKDMLMQALMSCRMAAWFYKRNHNTAEFNEYTILGFETGEKLSDEMITTSADYTLLARDYHNLMLNRNQPEQAQRAQDRMSRLYGSEWKDEIIKQENKHKYLAVTPPEEIINA